MLVVGVHCRIQASERVPDQPSRIAPPFPEGGFDVPHRRTPDLELGVMPRRCVTPHGCHPYRLRVTLMRRGVVAGVAQVDATDERHVVVRASGMTQHDELLVV